MGTTDEVSHFQLRNYGMEKDIRDDMTGFKAQVDEVSLKVARLELELNLVEKFYSVSSKIHVTTPRGSLNSTYKDMEKYVSIMKKRLQESSHVETDARKKMQELMDQLGDTLTQLTQHRWAEPFMKPVDVEGLGLLDYYQVIEKPMDFTTIKTKMEAKDGTGYKNVHEICADVRLIFKNAMRYNKDRDDVHVKAKTMLAKFEKLLQLLPEVIKEEKRQIEAEAAEQFEIQLAQETNHAKMAKVLCVELDELDLYLGDLKKTILKNCRKMSYEEKNSLSHAITQLAPEDLFYALSILSQDNPDFQATSEEVDIDLDAQSPSTLWRLKIFIKELMQSKSKIVADTDDKNKDNNKRKIENEKFLAQNSQKKSKRNHNGC